MQPKFDAHLEFTLLTFETMGGGERRVTASLVAGRDQHQAIAIWLDANPLPLRQQLEVFVRCNAESIAPAHQSGFDSLLGQDRVLSEIEFARWRDTEVRSDEPTWDFVGYMVEDYSERVDDRYFSARPSDKWMREHGPREGAILEMWGSRRVVCTIVDDGQDEPPYDSPSLEDRAPLEHFTERG